MSPIPFIQPILAATFHYPLKLCATTTLTTYILSLVTGNVSQVDRVWTFLPTIYTAYWALFPLWPRQNTVATWLFPYVPAEVPNNLVKVFSPRAVLMFGLVVSDLVASIGASRASHHCSSPGCAGCLTILGDAAYSTCKLLCTLLN